MTNRDIPRIEFTPEQVALVRLQHKIDYADAGPKAPVSGFLYRGVRIESRWAVYAELEAMKRVIDAIPELMARRLASIWCDSNCGANYIVGVREGLWIPDLKRAIGHAVVKGNGGHNGVAIDEGRVRRADIDPDWQNE